MGWNPNWPRGYIPKAKEWAAAFAQKKDESSLGVNGSDLAALQAVESLLGNEIIIVGVPNGDGTFTIRSATGLLFSTYGISVAVSAAVAAAMQPAALGSAMLAWFNSLPTTPPSDPGVLWNNSGTLALSQPIE